MTGDELRNHIRGTGLSQVEFAHVVAGVDPRTVRRWVAGTTPIPVTLSRWMARAQFTVTPHVVVVTIPRIARRRRRAPAAT